MLLLFTVHVVKKRNLSKTVNEQNDSEDCIFVAFFYCPDFFKIIAKWAFVIHVGVGVNWINIDT